MSNEKKILGEAQGHNGLIQYEIDVNDNKINDLKILKHSETGGIFGQVIEKLKDSVVEQQSFDVDAVSGATDMTQSILDSAKEAVNKEGVQLTPHLKPKKGKETQYYNTDVVVIGGGEAGLVAGARALKLGKKVILVEKNGYLGGATILNGSNVTGTGSKVSAAIFGDNGDSPARLAEDTSRESKNTNYPDMTNLMVQNIGPAIDFISAFADLHYQKAQTQTVEHSVERQIELPSASSYEFIDKVSKAFEANGGQILLDTKVIRMLKDANNQVSGVIAEHNGDLVVVAAKSVVLASGGYGANQAMRGEESKGIDYYGPMTATGDAYAFNEGLDLKTHDMGWYKIYPHGVETEPGIAKLTTYASKKSTDLGGIYVNSEGHRIVNESAPYTDFRDAILAQPDRIAYMLMDERTWKEVHELLVLHDFQEKELQKFFDEKGQSPVFVKGSLAEVAAEAGVNYGELQKTVDEYQKNAAEGVDPEFHRDAKFLHPFEGDVFYLVEQRGRFATTLGGYSVDTRTLQLVNKDDEDVPNYFAAGEVAGGANGHDSMPSMMNTWGISSGYFAGLQASQNADQRDQTPASELPTLALVVGTNASKTYNRMLARYMKDMFYLKAKIDVLEIKDVPMFNEDLVKDEPAAVTEIADKIEAADGVIIATPEYDHAVPAALKSVLEWLSCERHSLKDKKVMIVGASLGIQGTVRAQTNLRQVLDSPGVDAFVMPGHEFMMAKAPTQFDENESINNYGTMSFLDFCFSSFLSFLK